MEYSHPVKHRKLPHLPIPFHQISQDFQMTAADQNQNMLPIRTNILQVGKYLPVSFVPLRDRAAFLICALIDFVHRNIDAVIRSNIGIAVDHPVYFFLIFRLRRHPVQRIYSFQSENAT